MAHAGQWRKVGSLRGVAGPKGDSVVGPPGPPGPKGDSIAGPAGPRGLAGKDGELGPVPRHEVDDQDKPTKIRFELERDPATDKTLKWGPWIDFRKLLPRTLPRQRDGMGGTTQSERRVIELIQRYAPADPAATGDFTRVEVTYVSATDNRPSRIVYDVAPGESEEARFDWGTGEAGTHQYKGTAEVGALTNLPVWTIYRSTLDSAGRPSVRQRLANVAWDSRAGLGW